MSEFKPINANVTNPKDSLFKKYRNDKAECNVITCNNSENCALFAKGQCIKLNFFDKYCPHGRTGFSVGFTKNAKNYSSWINEKKETYKDILNVLTAPSDIMAKIGDYVYLPYSHIDMNKNVPFLKHDLYLVSGIKIVKVEDFNIDNIIKIIKFMPMAMMGGEITSYQKEVVPLFIKHLSEVFPELYNQLVEKKPELNIIVENYNYVGRKALLKTVNVGSVFTYHKGREYEEKWTWDGTYMNYTGKHLTFSIIKFEEASIRLIPKDDATITIENNNQVNKNTIFVS